MKDMLFCLCFWVLFCFGFLVFLFLVFVWFFGCFFFFGGGGVFVKKLLKVDIGIGIFFLFRS